MKNCRRGDMDTFQACISWVGVVVGWMMIKFAFNPSYQDICWHELSSISTTQYKDRCKCNVQRSTSEILDSQKAGISTNLFACPTTTAERPKINPNGFTSVRNTSQRKSHGDRRSMDRAPEPFGDRPYHTWSVQVSQGPGAVQNVDVQCFRMQRVDVSSCFLT